MAEPFRMGPALAAEARAARALPDRAGWHRCPLCGSADVAHMTPDGGILMLGCAMHRLRWNAESGALL